MNKVIITGNLTRDPELRYLPTGTAICDFTVAVNEYRKESEDIVHFFDCVAFGAQAESLSKYQFKGSELLIEGKLQQDRWEDKETGKPRSKVKINAQYIKFIGAKQTAEQQPATTNDDDNVPY